MASFDVKSNISVLKDDKWIKVEHPQGLFTARIRNVPREVYETPFLLRIHVTFDAPELNEAYDIAEARLADLLSMLALVTGGSFVQQRIRLIIDGTEGSHMRTGLIWGHDVEHYDPFPLLHPGIAQTIEHLLETQKGVGIWRALRWYRLGIRSTTTDIQFQCFWFALELMATAMGPAVKVEDKCPHCRTPLYCDTCKKYPKHRPFVGQKIRSLIQATDSDLDDASLDRLESTRHSLMHGDSMFEIEEELPDDREHVVDTLGRIVRQALVNQFPEDTRAELAGLNSRSSYVHQTLAVVSEISSVVPIDAEGEFDIDAFGPRLTVEPTAPPQSEIPYQIRLRPEQLETLSRLCHRDGDHQDMCRRICYSAEAHNDLFLALVVATDMKRILAALEDGETGDWQDVFREILGRHVPRSSGAD